MKLRYGDLLQLLERLHALPGSRRTATESRLKNFSRIGFPNAIRVGSGERAEYGADQIVQLLFAFELLRLRVPPAVIAEIVRTEWSAIAAAFANAACALKGALDAASRKDRPLLAMDAVALHEAGKTVRRGELLTTMEVVAANELTSRTEGWRSILLIDPSAVVVDAAAQLPWLRRSVDQGEFLADIAELRKNAVVPSAERRAALTDEWQETGYGVRRALADALAVLRVALPRPEGAEPRLSPRIKRRLEAALHADGAPLSRVLVGGRALDASLRVYLHWIGASTDGPLPSPKPADTLALRTAAQTADHLHDAMVDAIMGEISSPFQDV